MQLNPEMEKTAKELISQKASLPSEIPGFPGFFVANAADMTIEAAAAFVEDNISYKIGTKIIH